MKRKEWFKRALGAIEKNDPAAQDRFINKRYPGFKALYHHRFTHKLWEKGWKRLARRLSEYWKHKTGIEIHPGAKIGPGVFIDHGSGVVIGETSEIGEGCVLYQGVTLGGIGKKRQKRHPTLGKNVVVGAGAKLLGNIKIGDNAKIGAGSVVVKDVPSSSTVVGVPGRVVCKIIEETGEKINTSRERLPDPIIEALVVMGERIEQLERQIEILLKKSEDIKS
jgi:serine O-acetyltransferase